MRILFLVGVLMLLASCVSRVERWGGTTIVSKRAEPEQIQRYFSGYNKGDLYVGKIVSVEKVGEMRSAVVTFEDGTKITPGRMTVPLQGCWAMLFMKDVQDISLRIARPLPEACP